MGRLRRRLSTAVVAGIVLVLAASGSATAATPLPAHVFAPYFETWTSDGITATAQQSGARYFTLAFLETLNKHSCTLAWNGSSGQTVASGRYSTDIASLRAIGGDVVPSLGGWSADQGGTEIGDSCTDVNAIALAYEALVTTLRHHPHRHGHRGPFADQAGRHRSPQQGNRAARELGDRPGQAAADQLHAADQPRRAGRERPGGAAERQGNGTRVDVVNIMTFDYYDRTTTDMGGAAISALGGLHSQLATLYPAKTSAQLWAMEGTTLMPGLDDYPKKTEVTTLADASRVLSFARANGASTLSMWAIQRDHGGCAGQTGANDCSGIAQNDWDFTHTLAPFTGP